ncbi:MULTISPECIES: helix-turn-helix transcriptional regulator [unclassified Novosphingobium]|uniref:helix-turn-helix domain-containing protein n=1 Tax=unclassified Novosphingobium TaxID=2644732 RepID=UPI00146D307F|nr:MULTISPECIES: helix-turn-helix transcriptional regulator [unclassified Novosphingobium]NMN06705.1 transcriptional regulator with XRE-family HTH domain [Novosphingobium sp. SG919]NMN88844.1 transcriptional regulator with XRE-family HTH domain [Novosphingobium sp. SG916]
MYDDSIRVGRHLKSAVKVAGQSQKAVAKAFGVSQPWISRIFNGHFGDRTDLVMRLCEEYGVEPYAHNDSTEFDDLANRLRELWDGTPAGAKRLRALLNAVIEINRCNGDAEGDQARPPTNVRATSRPKA